MNMERKLAGKRETGGGGQNVTRVTKDLDYVVWKCE